MSKSVKPQFKYINLLFLSEKGGSWKTTTSALVISIAIARNAKPRIYEVDEQNLLLDLFPEYTTLIRVPSSDDIIDSDVADVEAFSDMFEAMASRSNEIILGDIGANLDGRLIAAGMSSGLADQLTASSRRTAVIIPFLADEDSVLCAARTAERIMIGLPDADIIFCRCADGPLEPVINSGEAGKAYHDVIAPHTARNGLLEIPLMRPSLLTAFKLLRVAHTTFVSNGDELLMARGYKPAVARAIVSKMKIFVGTVEEQTERLLGFRSEAEQLAAE
jgi:hypothetical protein